MTGTFRYGPISRRLSIAVMLAVILVGCGRGLSGTYVLTDGTGMLFKKLTFTSGNKVELTTIMDSTSEATYEVDGDKIKISAAGETQIFTIDKNKCVVGGGMIGTFCKK